MHFSLKILFCLFIANKILFAQASDQYDEKQNLYYENFKTLNAKFKNSKSPHFQLIYEDEQNLDYLKKLETFYEFFVKNFVKSDTPLLLNCRIQVVIWSKQKDFNEHALNTDKIISHSLLGYYKKSKEGWPRINIFNEQSLKDSDFQNIQFEITLLHELTHALITNYISENDLPLWVHEGLADYFSYFFIESFYPKYDFSKIKTDLKSTIKENKKSNLDMAQLLLNPNFSDANIKKEFYIYSWAICAYMMTKNKLEFIKLINDIKQQKLKVEFNSNNNPTSIETLSNKNEEIFKVIFQKSTIEYLEFIFYKIKLDPDFLNAL